MKLLKKPLELKDVTNFQQLILFVNSKSIISKKGCVEIIGKSVQLAMQVSGQKQIELMHQAYCVNREGTQEQWDKDFNEWIVKVTTPPVTEEKKEK